MLNKIIPIITLVLFASCTTKNNEDNVERVLKPLEETELISDMSQYVTSVDFLPVSNDIPLAPIKKALITQDGNMVLCDMANQLVLLNKDGSVSKIADKGRAATEYSSLGDIALCGDYLMILDNDKVKYFNLSDKNDIKVVDLPKGIPFDAIAPSGASGVFAYSAYPGIPQEGETYLLYNVTPNNDYVPLLKQEDYTTTLFNISQSCNNDYFLRPQDSNHIFYKLTSSGIVPVYKIDFEEQNIPSRYYYSVQEDMGKFMMSEYYKLPMELCQTKSHLFFHCCGPNAVDHNFIYSLNGKSGIHWISEQMDFIAKVIGADKEHIYVFYSTIDSTDSNVGVLTKYINQEFAKRSMTGESFIVKLKFKV